MRNETLPEKMQELLKTARAKEASDFFLVPGEPPAFRVDGIIERTEGNPLLPDEIESMASAIIGIDELQRVGREKGEVHRTVFVEGECNARFAASRSRGNYTLTVRMGMTHIPKPEELGIPEALLKAVLSPNGLVITSGPAGCGKMTAAYSLLDYINSKEPCHICTVEDPVMAPMTPKQAIVQQREIGMDIPDTLSGIRAARAQDLDVLFVGEIKTLEELQACISAAETGHLVITVLHTTSPEEAIQRMIEVFPVDAQKIMRRSLAGLLRAVSSQRLMPRADKPGRVAAYGVLIPDEEMRQAISEGRDFMARTTPFPEGCQTIQEHLERLLKDGVIDQETASRVI